jgi:NADH:ubiquinone oxidoreductase subunit 6 (subunit J)
MDTLLLGFIIFLGTLIVVFKNFSYFSEDDDSEFSFFTFDSLDDINTIRQILYNYYVSCFLISGLVLVVAMISSIVLTSNFTSRRKSELIYRQLARIVK